MTVWGETEKLILTGVLFGFLSEFVRDFIIVIFYLCDFLILFCLKDENEFIKE
jgi:hypothetical protein